jgi:hypothetical protein
MMGDDLLVEGDVTNYGTIDAIDVPFTMSIKEQITTVHLMDYVEGTYYDPEEYDPYADEVFEDPEGLWQANDFGSYGGAWHINKDFDFVSPTHTWICADGSNHYPAGLQDCLMLDFDAVGAHPQDYEDAIKFDLEGMVNYRFGATPDAFCGMIRVASTWITLSGSFQSGNSPGWIDWSFSDHISMYMNPGRPNLVAVCAWIGGIFGSGIEDITGIGVQISGGTFGLDTVGGAGGAWSGVQFDNLKLYSTVTGAEVYKTVIILPEIKAETITDPADIISLDYYDGLIWEDMPTGDYVEEKFVPLDVVDVDDPINDDNDNSAPVYLKDFKVITDITCVDEVEVEHMDLTTCDSDWWHITSSGYNQYAWCGDEATGVYASGWNEAMMLVSDDNSAHDTCEASMDWSADAFAVQIDFDSYEDFEGFPFDPGYIEINPHVSEPGSHWYTLAWNPYPWNAPPWFMGFPGFGFYWPFWFTWSFPLVPMDFEDFVTLNPYLMDEPGGFTDDMGLRFRFISDGSWEYRGWLIDNLALTGAVDDIYEINPCDDMDRLIATGICGGDYWYEDTVFGGWTCQDQLALYVPNDLNNPLVWSTSVPQATSAELTFYHDYDLELGGDYVYLEFSTDGGSSWIAPVAFSGIGSGIKTVDMSAFTGENILIRWRMITNDNTPSDHYSVKDMCITGQVDTVPPTTTGTLSGTVIHGWYSSPVTFTATATDDVSGVDEIYYKIDGGSTLTYSAPITISTNGEHYIEYWAVDNVGNEEIHHITPNFKIDTGSAPSVSITAPTPGLYLFGNQLLSMSKVFIIGGFTVQATASDADSGVYKVEFQLDGTTFGESTTAPYGAYCGLKHTGAGTITVIAEDFTGSTAQDTLAITYFKFL